jgi:hypothetical protein
MHEEPEATEEEHEEGSQRRIEEDDMRGPAHGDPDSVDDDAEDEDA